MNLQICKRARTLLVGLLGGLSLGTVLWARAAPPHPKVPDVVRARCFELVDQEDSVRARLVTDEDETTSLIIYDKSGDQRIVLAAEGAKEEHGHISDAATALSLFNHKKTMDIHLLASDDGDGLLTFGHKQKSPQGQVYASTYVDLKVSSMKGGVRLRLSALGDGNVWRTPDKGEASLELRGENHSLYWNAANQDSTLK